MKKKTLNLVKVSKLIMEITNINKVHRQNIRLLTGLIAEYGHKTLELDAQIEGKITELEKLIK